MAIIDGAWRTVSMAFIYYYYYYYKKILKSSLSNSFLTKKYLKVV